MLSTKDKLIAEQEKEGLTAGWDEFDLTNIIYRLKSGVGISLIEFSQQIVRQLPADMIDQLICALQDAAAEKFNG